MVHRVSKLVTPYKSVLFNCSVTVRTQSYATYSSVCIRNIQNDGQKNIFAFVIAYRFEASSPKQSHLGENY